MFRRLSLLAFSLCALFLLPAIPTGQASTTDPQPSTVTIAGSVVDASLSPLAGATVVLERGARIQARTTTAADGGFRFVDVAPGSYRIRVDLKGFPSLSRDFQVPAGARTLSLPLVLARADEAAPKASSDARETGVGGRRPPVVAAVPPPPPPGPPANASPSGDASRGGIGGASPAARIEGPATQYPPSNQYAIAREEPWSGYHPPASGERYAHVDANRFQWTRDQPLSTFGADVDTASYANVRRFLSQGQLPPADAVRVEELVNYFRFNYAEPRGRQPIALTTEIGDCPWAPSHKLVLIGARARASAGREIEGRNIVLLIDVSGSMAPAERLPLLKTALGMFVDTLRPDDRIAIVTYAGSSGVALPSTPARRRDVIQDAIARLNAGGSTNGGQGLILAYRMAREAFIPGGVNRVILATDGDFNVGITSQRDLLGLIEREKESGVFLSVFGVGSGNLKDSTMEMLADKGNGHYSYLDSLQEARRVLIRETDSTLETVAKDVKFQVEFNPAVVSAWKLVGYENRVMAAEHFNDDRKDGGEMGAGHTVTVLYEVVPTGVSIEEERLEGRPVVDPLRYQDQSFAVRPAPAAATEAARTGEWLTVKARYKAPEGDISDLITQPVRLGGRVQFLPFAAAVAEFGLLLRDQSHDRNRWDALNRRVGAIAVPPSLVADKNGFVELVGTARALVALM